MLSRLERSFNKEKEHKNLESLDVDLIMTLIRKSAESTDEDAQANESLSSDDESRVD